ncbi:MAG: arylesterase [Pseudooceanicola sp.]|nr:arylesterase [Pseudooceanicola sp.]
MRKFLAAIALILSPLLAQADELTIAALGDSLTQGYGLPPEDGFVSQLQRWLDGQGAEVTLLNAGVSGDTTAGGAARVGWTLTPEVGAMIVTLGGNDLLRGLDPGEARKNLDVILKAAGEAGVPVLLIGMRAPGNYGPEYKAAFEANYAELSAQYGTLFLPDFFAGLGGGGDPAALRAWFQADGIHPNAAGVAKIVAAIGPSVLELVQRAE